jgi:hypothetical protein
MEAVDSLPIFPLPITNTHPEPEDSNHIPMSYLLQIKMLFIVPADSHYYKIVES